GELVAPRSVEVCEDPERRSRTIDQSWPQRHYFDPVLGGQLERREFTLGLARSVRVTLHVEGAVFGQNRWRAVTVHGHRAQVHHPPDARFGGGEQHVSSSVDVDGRRFGEGVATICAVEQEVTSLDCTL